MGKPTPLFFTHGGEGRAMNFQRMKYPLKDWKSAHMETVPGLDFMIGGKDSCYGDSGGPLWVREEKGGALRIAYMGGVVSSGSGAGHCAVANSPGLYVRVKNYLAWIKKHAASGACVKNPPKKKKSRKIRKKKSKKKKWKNRKKRKKNKSGRRQGQPSTV